MKTHERANPVNREYLEQHKGFHRKKLSFFRRITIASFDAVRSGHNMIAMVELDVTNAREALRTERKKGRTLSFLAYVIKCISLALDENRELNSIRCGKHIVEYEGVDVNLPIELKSQEERAPHLFVIRDASKKTIERITAEISNAKKRYEEVGYAGESDRRSIGLMKVLMILPGFVRSVILRRITKNPARVREISGTTFLTSVGMFGSISGFVVPYIVGERAVYFALGSIVRKPAVVKQEVIPREFLSMTMVFNHDIVDGAPAARFANRLRRLIEGAESLRY